MEDQELDRVAFIVSEVYDRRELRDIPFMLEELSACYPELSPSELEGIIAGARRRKFSPLSSWRHRRGTVENPVSF